MKNLKKVTVLAALLLLVATAVMAHPHFRKSVSTKLGNVEVKVVYFTVPANLEHVAEAVTGAFTAGSGQIELSGDLSAGDVSIPAGQYQIGAIKNGEGDWTLALYPGQLQRGQEPDMSKLIKLQSSFSDKGGNAGHAYFDVMPGTGEMEGKAVLVWHFGPLQVEGALS